MAQPRMSGQANTAMITRAASAALPDTRVGTFTQALYDEAKKNGWSVISMKNDWKRIFAFDLP
jgi:hypothetical protein